MSSGCWSSGLCMCVCAQHLLRNVKHTHLRFGRVGNEFKIPSMKIPNSFWNMNKKRTEAAPLELETSWLKHCSSLEESHLYGHHSKDSQRYVVFQGGN
jgi:hypothetical protein